MADGDAVDGVADGSDSPLDDPVHVEGYTAALRSDIARGLWLSGRSLSQQYTKLAEGLEAEGHEEEAAAARACAKAFSFGRREGASTGTRFGPMVVMDGRRSAIPDDLTREELAFLARECASQENPFVLSWLEDVLWETGQGHEHARRAADAYLNVREHLLHNRELSAQMELVDALQRSLVLRCLVRDASGVGAVCDAIGETVRVLFDERRPRWGLEIIEAVLDNRAARQRIGLSVLDALCAEGTELMRETWPDESGHLVRSWLELSVRIAGRMGSDPSMRERRTQIAASLEDAASAAMAETGCGGLKAAHFAARAVEAYRTAGGCADAVARATALLERANRKSEVQMKRFSVRARLPREAVEEQHRRLVSLAAEHGAEVLSPVLWVPIAKDVRGEAEEQRQASPLLSLLPSTVVSDGRTVSASSAPEEQHRAQFVETYRHHLRWRAAGLSAVTTELLRAGQLGEGGLLPLLRRCDLVEGLRFEMVALALDHYHRGDFVSAIHLLVFQIEGMLRDVVGAVTGRETVAKDDVSDARLLGDLLSEPALLDVYGEDIVEFLRVLLSERSGFNVRNEVAHGMWPRTSFTEAVADYLPVAMLSVCSRCSASPCEDEAEVPDG